MPDPKVDWVKVAVWVAIPVVGFVVWFLVVRQLVDWFA